MSIQFLLGSSGSGKSTEILNKIISESMAHPECMYYLIVPEQYTMEAQRDIVTMHPNGGTMNIDAIGFNRLAYRIFDELSVNPGDVLQDFGKSMLIRKILWDQRETLSVYGSYMDKLGFVDEMKSMMSELFQYAVKRLDIESVMEDMTEETESVTYSKLKDIQLIYEEFERYTSNGYIVAEQMTELLTSLVKQSDIMKKSCFYFDGFTGFTPVQMMLLREMMKNTKGLVFSFTIDSRDISITNIKEHELFYMTKTAIKMITKIATEEHVDILPNIIMEDKISRRFENNAELAFLEKQLFRFPYRKYHSSLHNIEITACDNTREEVYCIAENIRRLLDKGYRYKDIAIVAGDLTESARYYNQVMEEYHIPVFIDANVLMKSNPCSETIRSLLDMYAAGFSYDSVFRFLKTGMTDIPTDDIEYLENYAIQRGLRGYSSWSREVPEYYEKNAVRSIEEIRKQFMDLLVDITPVFRSKKSTVRDYVEAVYCFLVKIDIHGKLANKSGEFYRQGRYDEGDAYSQIMDKVVMLFDKIVQLLSDEKMSVKEFGDIVDTGLSDIEIGIVPPTVDRVLVGDITRSRLNHIKVLFLAGANEGIIPKAAKKGKILTDGDRKTLEQHGLVLAPSDKVNAYIEQFYLYMNITKPSDKLYISYRRLGQDEKETRPSYLLSRIMNIFPELKVQEYSMENEGLYTDNAILRYIVRCTRNDGIQSISDKLCKLLDENGYGKELKCIFSGKNYRNQAMNLSKETVGLLYGNELIQSVSRLETFANCSFAYFLKYGLGLKERDQYHIDMRQVGSILHQVMERVFKTVRNTMGNDWNGLMDETRRQMVSNAVAEAAREYGGSFFADYARNQYMLRLVENMAQRSVEMLQSHISYGDMKPGMIEKVFDSERDELCDYTFDLANDMRMVLNGKIDRVDTCEEDGSVYIKIIDYKSSSRELKLDRILSGLQLQLLAYSGIAYELEKKIYPDKDVRLAGLLYYSFDDPIVEMQSLDIDENATGFICESGVSDKKMEAARLKGFVNSDKEVLLKMDRTLTTALPIKLDKQGEPKSNHNILKEEQLRKLLSRTRENMFQLGQRIAAGCTDINPIKDGNETGCDYCAFKKICRFDTKCGGNSYRLLDKKVTEKFYEEDAAEDEMDRGTE
ncbi:MAG: exodeoxyribonuclease V subunit gamma [Coprococcus sp.]|nr:exodeoxyribonuclease V subunit gamma [Coprococcus sp.]